MSALRSQARLRLHRPPKQENIMLKIGGKPFRCHCNANVFRKESWMVAGRRTEVFVCNGCGEGYAGS